MLMAEAFYPKSMMVKRRHLIYYFMEVTPGVQYALSLTAQSSTAQGIAWTVHEKEYIITVIRGIYRETESND